MRDIVKDAVRGPSEVATSPATVPEVTPSPNPDSLLTKPLDSAITLQPPDMANTVIFSEVAEKMLATQPPPVNSEAGVMKRFGHFEVVSEFGKTTVDLTLAV